ncbi:hypothetical protein [Actinomycetospora aeridis]|uniref:Uncharacterized protein n=1 Tax=Actinomycetospora aeridis TaxID=3129231 RepID=A0ABU8N956_9PSEU
MTATEPTRPGAGTPVFVDASGRRRRGVSVLGYLGASAAAAYLAAFGLTVGTQTVSLQPVGATLTPSPPAPEDDADEGDEPEVVAASAPVATPVATTVTRHAAPRTERTSERTTERTSERTSARHARAERPRHVVTPRAAPARLVPVRVVRAPQRVVQTTVTTTTVVRESPRPTHHHHGHTSHHQTRPSSTDAVVADVLDTVHAATQV